MAYKQLFLLILCVSFCSVVDKELSSRGEVEDTSSVSGLVEGLQDI